MQRIKGISDYRKTLRDKIIETSMDAFAKQGIRAVKMDDVAQSLAISKRTVYEIFENKENLLFEGIKKYKIQKNMEMEQEASKCNNVMDILLYAYYQKVDEFKRTSPAFYSDLSRYPKIVDFLKKDADSSRQSFKQFLQRGMSEGYFRSDINIDLVAKMFESVSEFVMENKLYKSYTIEDIFRCVIFVSLRGICTPKGIEILDKFTTTEQ